MLVKITNYDFSGLGTGNTATLDVILSDIVSTVDTPLDLSTGSAPAKELFSLAIYNTDTPTTLSISSVAFKTDGSDGKIVVTFIGASGSVSPYTPIVNVGDVLVLSQGSTVGTGLYSRIMNTASIDTGLGDTPITNTSQYILTPNPNIRTDKNYNFSLTFLEENATQINPYVVALTTPITIQGLTIGSIKFEMVTSANGSGGKYISNTPVAFKVTFYSSNDGTGEAITFEGAVNDILSVNFIPV